MFTFGNKLVAQANLMIQDKKNLLQQCLEQLRCNEIQQINGVTGFRYSTIVAITLQQIIPRAQQLISVNTYSLNLRSVGVNQAISARTSFNIFYLPGYCWGLFTNYLIVRYCVSIFLALVNVSLPSTNESQSQYHKFQGLVMAAPLFWYQFL